MPSNGFEYVSQGRLDGKQRNRLKGLFDMMYRPSELAEEIGVSQNQVYRVYVADGCPHQRDEHNHIWINGADFSEWYKERYKKPKLKEGEAWCVSCKKPVEMIYRIRKEKDGLVFLKDKCQECGNKIVKIISYNKARS